MKKFALLATATAFTVTCALATVSPAMAADAAKTGTGPNPYSDCGIGAALFPHTTWAAVISNVIWDIGTTAIVSAVSSKDTCSGANAQAALYINQTYASLEIDAAKGSGEYLAGLTKVMHCSTSAQPALYAVVRSGLTDLVQTPGFADLDRSQKAERLFNIVDTAATTQLAGQCYTS